MNEVELPVIKINKEGLPSRGKCYPDNIEISYHGYTFGEIQNISASKGMSPLDIFKRAIQGITVNGMPKEKLTLPDVLYLGVARKLSSIGSSNAQLSYLCSGCKKEQKKIFATTDIEFNDLEIDGSEIEFELSNGKTYVMSPANFSDMVNLSNGLLSTRFHKMDMTQDKVANYAIMCRNYGFDEAYKDFSTLTNVEDIAVLEEFNKMIAHDMKRLEAVCESCGHTNNLALEGREVFINPCNSGAKSIRDRLRVVKRA